ncbi:GyrI-like domain-containing protein [Ochrovirga pacifica]|uniref:GyrI-like domain-containing protein n=1 Tax=Ochrovirga pacifica TaxID=1042376 RepID=UPI0002558384|nr:GyrI-like domain-containing protein [Ochrovirga pacifica]
MQPRIITLTEKKLVGLSKNMSLTDNKTQQLWSEFMACIDEIPNRISEDKISMQMYDELYFMEFSPNRPFVKWATVEVYSFDEVPASLTSFQLMGGLYAVFNYKGLSDDPSIFQYIYTEWLPNSGYELDKRPHFEVLGKHYKNNDPNSEEEIWIPIKKLL